MSRLRIFNDNTPDTPRHATRDRAELEKLFLTLA